MVSHNGNAIEAINISKASEIMTHDLTNVDVIGIDEVQFFDDEIVSIIKSCRRWTPCYCCWIDMDFRGKLVEPMPKLMAVSEQVTKLQAVCAVCGSSSSTTQRLINGKPAESDHPIILVGANESYEPRCRAHHIVAPSDNNKEEL
ncbi:thymidine kinase [Staphylococcus aureus]